MRINGGHGRRVVLGVTGGIAAYKAIEVCRGLVDAGVHVIPVLTDSALRFVGEATFSALASERVRRSLFEDEDAIPHTRLGQQADAIVVVPATAHLLGKYAAGLADDLLSATLLATRAPVVLCPAMHTEMWEHPAVQRNVARLVARQVVVVPPAEGRLAGGDSGRGRLADPSVIVERVLKVLDGIQGRGRDLEGVRIVVSAGGTREPIDPVRYLSNRSSGKQGHALAEAAARRGARVTLVTTTRREVPAELAPSVDVVRVETAAEMEEAIEAVGREADVVVMAAAVADFRPKAPSDHKLVKEDGVPDVVLEPTPDILSALGVHRRPGQVLVGFAAETDAVLERGRRKLAAKGVDLLVVNDVTAPGAGFEHDTNAVTILEAGGRESELALAPKGEVANAVLDRVVARLGLVTAPSGDQSKPSSAPSGERNAR